MRNGQINIKNQSTAVIQRVSHKKLIVQVVKKGNRMLLKIGSRGNEVKELQEFLGIGADGIFGKGTAAAVKEF